MQSEAGEGAGNLYVQKQSPECHNAVVVFTDDIHFNSLAVSLRRRHHKDQ